MAINPWLDQTFMMWMLLSIGFYLLGYISLAALVEIRGVRGLALATEAICLGLFTLLLAVLRARTLGADIRLPMEVIYISIQVCFGLMILSKAVLVDLWLADHNDHKSVTTKLYIWFKETAKEKKLRLKREEEQAEYEDRQDRGT